MVKYRVNTHGMYRKWYRVESWRPWLPFWLTEGYEYHETKEDAYSAIEMLKDGR
jgi:hypothetical protein